MVKPSYKKGDVWCKECDLWIFKENIPKFTHLGKAGALLHNDCNWRVRCHSRMTNRRMIEISMKNRPTFNFMPGEFTKTDIINNKEKLEKWIESN